MSVLAPIAFLALLHLLGLALGAALLVLALRGGGEPGDEGWGGGGGPDAPPAAPRGGPPLGDARPARARLREPGRIADLLPRPPRRAAREPVRRRVPTR